MFRHHHHHYIGLTLARSNVHNDSVIHAIHTKMADTDKEEDDSEPVVLNVGGTIFETTYETLRHEPDTLLATLRPSSPEYRPTRGHFFFDRNPDIFNCVLDLYRTGELHLPHGFCGATLRTELKFWRIPEDRIGICCLQTYFKYDTDREVLDTLHEAFEAKVLDYNPKEADSSKWVKIKRTCWLFLDQPNSSPAAKVFSYFYLGIVVLSGILFCCGTHPDFLQTTCVPTNETDFGFLNPENPKEVLLLTTRPTFALEVGGWFVLIFFSIEFLIHFFLCPVKSEFFKSGLNVLDGILFVCMWMVFSFEFHSDIVYSNRHLGMFYLVLKSMMILRLFRLLRLVKQYSALRILTVSLVASLKELGLLLITFLMASVFFASFIYFAEFEEPSTFPHIFIGIWWSVVTMTTVGYGDTFPKSTPGHLVGSACAICGVLILSMPIAIVATKFSNFNDRNAERERSKNLKSADPYTPRESPNTSKLFLTKVSSVLEVKQSPT
ncbi:potassium voltage-gated channel protein egl-36-like [Ylistrum balloti]|uniref:potassium voltage-gated channel protein egl-36-like n=1 Tax=Ylistrum balloti TaxID=509963 RepID=UPI0029058E87|nr:potassium voltage-gated channel protein egl-36-like [Ylistrum balloti]